MPKIKDKAIQTGGGGGGNFTPRVKLRDHNEAVRIRFLTDFEDFVWDKFHRTLKDGQFAGFRVCEATQGKQCKWCIADPNSYPQTRWFAYVYEMSHQDAKSKDWTPVAQVKILENAVSHLASIERINDKFGTLLEHEFDWVRVGERGSMTPSYLLEVVDKSPVSKDVKKLSDELPDLEDLVSGKATITNEDTTPVTMDEDDETFDDEDDDDDDDDEVNGNQPF